MDTKSIILQGQHNTPIHYYGHRKQHPPRSATLQFTTMDTESIILTGQQHSNSPLWTQKATSSQVSTTLQFTTMDTESNILPGEHNTPIHHYGHRKQHPPRSAQHSNSPLWTQKATSSQVSTTLQFTTMDTESIILPGQHNTSIHRYGHRKQHPPRSAQHSCSLLWTQKATSSQVNNTPIHHYGHIKQHPPR